MNEIDLLSYWEHIKAEKELARIYSPEHPRRKEITDAANKILDNAASKTTDQSGE